VRRVALLVLATACAPRSAAPEWRMVERRVVSGDAGPRAPTSPRLRVVLAQSLEDLGHSAGGVDARGPLGGAAEIADHGPMTARRGAGWLVAAICVSVGAGARAGDETVAAGRWTSAEHQSVSGTAKVGAKFFLDVAVANDGSFKGTWEPYASCNTYPGAYGINIVSCQRSKDGKAASGRFDASAGTGRIALEGLGESAFTFKVTTSPKPKLDLELPRDWQKTGAAVLYEATLNPK
jgi:hypothetical protein